jgi:hypothetical protein
MGRAHYCISSSIHCTALFCYDITHIWCKDEYQFVADKTREEIQNTENWEYGNLDGVKEE